MIIKIQKRDPGFVMIDNRVINDPRLSWKAKGILVYLLSKPPTWKPQVQDIQNQGIDGESAVRTALHELIKYGYARRKKVRGAGGRIVDWEITIYEEPLGGFPDVENPHVDNPDVDEPHVENRDVNNTESSNTESSNKEVSKKESSAAALLLVNSQNAADLLTKVTGWIRVPGDIREAENALGVVMDIMGDKGCTAESYIRTYWEEFRRRYPRSTKLFWLTEWAAQGVIPDVPKPPTNGNGKPAPLTPEQARAQLEKAAPTFSADEETRARIQRQYEQSKNRRQARAT